MIRCNQSVIDVTDQSTLDLSAKAGRKLRTFDAAKKFVAVFEEKLAKKRRNSVENAEETRQNSFFVIKGKF